MEQQVSDLNSASVLSVRTYFTPEDFTDDEEMIAKTTENFVKHAVKVQSATDKPMESQAVRALFEQAGEIGLLGIEVPEKYDGFNLGKKVAGLVAEKMGEAGSFSVSYNIHAGVGTLPYVFFGTEQQKKKYLPKLVSGEWIGAYALTEPNAGSDALNTKTSAVLNETKTSWLLNGEKQWITNAQLADCYVVFAKTDKGMTAFIVERKFEGVSVGPEEKKMGINDSSTATLVLEDVLVPPENVLGEVGKGHHIALNILNMARLKLAFANIGTAKRALQLAVVYAKERKQFDMALADFTMIQEKLSNIAIRIYGAESAAYRTAGLMDEAIDSVDSSKKLISVVSEFMVDCATNKVNSSEMLDFAVDEALQVHGGYGYMREYEVENLYRDARINRIFEGTNEINRLAIAKGLLKKEDSNQDFTNLIVKESPMLALEREYQYLFQARQLFKLVLATITEPLKGAIEKEQEYLRLLADMYSKIFVMESALLRTEKAVSKNGKSQEEGKVLITEVLCEESYQSVKSAAISFVSGAVTDENERENVIKDIQTISVPLYSNIFFKKKEKLLEE